MTNTPRIVPGARFAWMIPLDEGALGMLPEHRQRRRINAARRLARIYVTRKARALGMIADDWTENTVEGRGDASIAVRVSARFTAHDVPVVPTVTFRDEVHEMTALELAEAARAERLYHPRMFFISTADEREAHAHALELLEELGAVMAAMNTRNPVRDSTLADVYTHHLDAIRRAILHHHDLEDPAGADDRARARRQTGR
jgi:hypothetical protein